MTKINCDIGERGSKNATDIELMKYIHIANIACGGHAGDRKSVRFFRDLGKKYQVEVFGHLSYPDKENFGRVSIPIHMDQLKVSLDQQYSLIPDVKKIKFHGALYNDSWGNQELAENLMSWLLEKGIKEVITPFDSKLAKLCVSTPIHIIAEAFAERRYSYSEKTGQLSLVNRKFKYASIHNCDEAVEHTMSMVNNQQVNAYLEDENTEIRQLKIPIRVDTICIHSDAAISLELAMRLSKQFA